MPFTLAHPAAVLPFARTKLVFSALVAGTLAPDVGYFLTFSSRHAESHSLNGLFTFCLPTGLLLLLLFHKLLKRPLLALLPATHQARVFPYAQGFRFGPASRFAIIVVSLLIGSATHLVWDSLTHETGWVVKSFPALLQPLFVIHDEPIRTYKVLQHGGSVLGLLVLSIVYFTWLKKTEPTRVNSTGLSPSWKIVIVGLMVAGACLAALLRVASPLISWNTFRGNVVNGGIAFVSIFVVETIVFSIIWHLRRFAAYAS
jgi:hypothetical protein